MIAHILESWHAHPPPMAPSDQQPGTRFLVAEVTEPPPPPSRREMRMIRRLAKAKAQSARATARRKFPDVPESELLTSEDVINTTFKQRAGTGVFKSVDGTIWPTASTPRSE